MGQDYIASNYKCVVQLRNYKACEKNDHGFIWGTVQELVWTEENHKKYQPQQLVTKLWLEVGSA